MAPSPNFDPWRDMPDLTGKVSVVTGGSAGSGADIVKHLARRGAKVYIAARSEAKSKAAIELFIKKEESIKPGQIQWLSFDLSDVNSVLTAADTLKREETKIDILINNAGFATASEEQVGDGWEIHMGSNYAGHFIFTNRILPLLKAASKEKDADVRVVTVGSNATYDLLPPNYEFNWQSPTFLQKPVLGYPWMWRLLTQPLLFYVDMIRYAVSKVALHMFAKELQRKFDDQNLPILSIAANPGPVASESVYTIGNAIYRTIVRLAFNTTDQGAITPLFAATARVVRENERSYAGNFLVPYGKLRPSHKVVEDREQVKAMWENTTKQVNEYLTKLGKATLGDW